MCFVIVAIGFDALHFSVIFVEEEVTESSLWRCEKLHQAALRSLSDWEELTLGFGVPKISSKMRLIK